MSRNTMDRLGVEGPEQAPVPMTETTGLSLPFATDHVDLPSQGKFYPENHPLHNVSSIEIKSMSAKEEDILTSQNLIKKGLVFDRLLSSIIVDKRINPNSLLVGDRNAILIATRSYSFGNEYKASAVCDDVACGESNKFVYDLDTVTTSFGGVPKDLEEILTFIPESKTFRCRLPRSGVTAEFRLLTGEEEKVLARVVEKANRPKGGEKGFSTTQLGLMVVSLNGIDEGIQLKSFIVNMPIMDSRFLRQMYQAAAPNVEMLHKLECAHCGNEQEITVPFGTEFFWPKQ